MASFWQGISGLWKARSEGRVTALPTAARDVATMSGGAGPGQQIRSAGAQSWFGPWQPIPPVAPPGTGGRAFDYPTGLNLNYIPRDDSPITFQMLRNFADSLPELRIVIEKRKDQIGSWDWDVQYVLARKDKRSSPILDPDPRIMEVKKFFKRPDRRHPFHTWLRMFLEEMLVIDAATLYPRKTRGGKLFSLDVVDGSTIKCLIDDSGRAPLPEDGPAYQQILHGLPAADFDLDELIYLPRNLRAHRLYGMSPVEQIILTVTIALQRNAFNLEYYKSGTLPEGFATLPAEWTQDQIAAFQIYFDSLLSGNGAERRKVRMMPDKFKWLEVRQPPLKDQYDEWLMRLICAAFSIPPSPFITDGARATAQTIQITASQEGIGPLKKWIKDAFDLIIEEHFGYEDLEFVWSGADEIDPLEKAQETQILVAAGIKTRDEARVDYGLPELGIPLTTDTQVFPVEEGIKATIEQLKNPTPEPDAGGAVGGVPKARARPKGPNVDETAASPQTKQPAAHKDPDKTARRTARKARIETLERHYAENAHRTLKDVGTAYGFESGVFAQVSRNWTKFRESIDLLRAEDAADVAGDVSAAGVMYRAPGGRVLFLRRTDGQGWAFPGGSIEGDETHAEAAARECEEEIGVAIDPAILTSPVHEGSNGYQTFSLDTFGEFTPALNGEHDDSLWCDPAAPPRPLHPGVEETLRALGHLNSG